MDSVVLLLLAVPLFVAIWALAAFAAVIAIEEIINFKDGRR